MSSVASDPSPAPTTHSDNPPMQEQRPKRRFVLESVEIPLQRTSPESFIGLPGRDIESSAQHDDVVIDGALRPAKRVKTVDHSSNALHHELDTMSIDDGDWGDEDMDAENKPKVSKDKGKGKGKERVLAEGRARSRSRSKSRSRSMSVSSTWSAIQARIKRERSVSTYRGTIRSPRAGPSGFNGAFNNNDIETLALNDHRNVLNNALQSLVAAANFMADPDAAMEINNDGTLHPIPEESRNIDLEGALEGEIKPKIEVEENVKNFGDEETVEEAVNPASTIEDNADEEAQCAICYEEIQDVLGNAEREGRGGLGGGLALWVCEQRACGALFCIECAVNNANRNIDNRSPATCPVCTRPTDIAALRAQARAFNPDGPADPIHVPMAGRGPAPMNEFYHPIIQYVAATNLNNDFVLSLNGFMEWFMVNIFPQERRADLGAGRELEELREVWNRIWNVFWGAALRYLDGPQPGITADQRIALVLDVVTRQRLQMIRNIGPPGVPRARAARVARAPRRAIEVGVFGNPNAPLPPVNHGHLPAQLPPFIGYLPNDGLDRHPMRELPHAGLPEEFFAVPGMPPPAPVEGRRPRAAVRQVRNVRANPVVAARVIQPRAPEARHEDLPALLEELQILQAQQIAIQARIANHHDGQAHRPAVVAGPAALAAPELAPRRLANQAPRPARYNAQQLAEHLLNGIDRPNHEHRHRAIMEQARRHHIQFDDIQRAMQDLRNERQAARRGQQVRAVAQIPRNNPNDPVAMAQAHLARREAELREQEARLLQERVVAARQNVHFGMMQEMMQAFQGNEAQAAPAAVPARQDVHLGMMQEMIQAFQGNEVQAIPAAGPAPREVVPLPARRPGGRRVRIADIVEEIPRNQRPREIQVAGANVRRAQNEQVRDGNGSAEGSGTNRIRRMAAQAAEQRMRDDAEEE